MNKSHVTSLAPSKELHDLMVEKGMEEMKTEFYWQVNENGVSILDTESRIEVLGMPVVEQFPAYLSSEIGEMLPRKYKTYYFDTIREGGVWRMTYIDSIKKEYLEVFEEKTESNARIKCYIYFIKEGLIK